MEDFAGAEVDELHALRVAAGFADFLDAGADHFAFVRDQHELVLVANGQSAGDAAGFFVGLHRDDAFAAAALESVFLEAGALADAFFAGDEELAVFIHDRGTDDVVAFVGADAPDADGVAALVAEFLFGESDAHAFMGDENDFVVAGGEFAIDETVVFLDLDGDDAAFADIFKIVEVRFFDDAAAGGEEDVEVFVPGFLRGFLALDANGGGDFLVLFEFEKIGDGAAFAGAGAFGNLEHALDIATAHGREEHEVVVRGGGEEVFDEVAVLFFLRFTGGHADHAFAAAFLGAEGTDECSFDEAVVGERDDDAVVGDEILDGDVAFGWHDVGAARGGEFFLQGAEFVFDDGENALLAGDDVEEVFDCGDEFVVFLLDAVTLETGELVEAKIDDVADLLFREFVFAIHDAGFAANENAEFFDGLLRPGEGEEFILRVVAVGGVFDDLDEVINVREGDEVAFEFLGFDFGLVEEEAGAAEDDLAAVLDVAIDRFFERKELWLAAVDRQHVHAERGLDRGVLEEIVDDDLWVAITLQLDDHAGVFGALVAHIADAGENFFIHEIGDSFDEFRAVHIVGNLGDDDALASAFSFFNSHASAHANLAATGLEILPDAGAALDQAACGKIRAGDVNHEAIDGDVGVIDLGADAVDAFAEIVRGDIRGHADGDAGAAIDEEVGKGCWKDGGLGLGLVVVRHKIDGAFIHIRHQDRAEMVEAGLGVTHGRGWIPFDRAEVALAVDELFAHGPVLRHVNEGRVDRLVAVRVVFTHRLAHDPRTLEVFAVRLHAEFVHRIENAALGGFESVARIRQGTGDDNRHRIVEERLRHFVGHIYRIYFFVLRIHGLRVVRLGKVELGGQRDWRFARRDLLVRSVWVCLRALCRT